MDEEKKELMVISQETTKTTISLFEAAPEKMVVMATGMANVLKDVVEKQKLFTTIGPTKYVRCEGWQTLGTMLGILPREKEVKELSDGSYEATIELINTKTGMIVGAGSALCAMDEPRWSKAQKYARRSMAITRATGKAYRISFGWVMTLAGYSATPAEEMPEVPFGPETYEETAEQKKTLAKIAADLKVTDKAELQELSNAMKGKPMSSLKELASAYIKNPLG